MRARSAFAFGTLAVAGLAVIAALFSYGCERRSQTLFTGLQGEAGRNPYLAAQRLLESMGAEAHGVAGLAELETLPHSSATIFMTVNRNGVVSARLSNALLDWTVRGGHLIVETWSLWDDDERVEDFLLDPLGIQQYAHETLVSLETTEESELDLELGLEVPVEEPEEEPVEEPELAQAGFADRDAPLVVEFDPRFYLLVAAGSAPRLSIDDANGLHLTTLALGEGYLTVVTDDYFLSTQSIGDHDHAELVWRLAHFAGRSGPIWIVWQVGWPGFMTLAWRHGWMVLVSLAALAALWVWSASRRAGPLRPDEPLERRRLMEHVEATGRFLARRGGREALAEGVRDAVMARVRARHPTWVRLDPAELATRVAGRSGLARERVQAALAPASAWTHESFVTHIATLERIRQAL